ncbi:class I SAM-dependent methyltransferase [Saccharomonospora sp. NPDC046836]|uniref:class I SAM-dependent methyltransferase n=1 Tax=Saccharomonospora sp. NPDC046836 TaxID=3156921 RepID=UPI0033CFBCE8
MTPVFAARAVQTALAALGRSHRQVLEVGCGRGDTLRLVADLLPGTELTGIDPSHAAIAAARELLGHDSRISLYRHAAEDLLDAAVADRVSEADLVLVHLTVGLWPDVVGGLHACVGRLSPGGLCYVLDLLRPNTEHAAAAYLAPALTGDEIRYVRDQMAAWYSTDEVEWLAESVCGNHVEVRHRIGFSSFAEVAAGVTDVSSLAICEPTTAVRHTETDNVFQLFFERS